MHDTGDFTCPHRLLPGNIMAEPAQLIVSARTHTHYQIGELQKMARTHSESSEDYEFIETPPAPSPQVPVHDCGVRTTSVR